MNKQEIENQLQTLSYFNKFSKERQEKLIQSVHEEIYGDHGNLRTAKKFVCVIANPDIFDAVADEVYREVKRDREIAFCGRFIDTGLNDDEMIADALENYVNREDCQQTIFTYNSTK